MNGETFLLDLTKGNSLYSLVAAPGDFNGDGHVDAVDYTVWRDTLGSTDRFSGRRQWRSPDRRERLRHLEVPLRHRLPGGAGQVAASVPEPASAMLLIACRGTHRWSTS